MDNSIAKKVLHSILTAKMTLLPVVVKDITDGTSAEINLSIVEMLDRKLVANEIMRQIKNKHGIHHFKLQIFTPESEILPILKCLSIEKVNDVVFIKFD